ncbi:hypothetical protein FQZ97_1057090 [compost metagenome]
MRLFGRAVALAVVARPAGRHHVHPQITPVLAQRHDVLAGQFFLDEMFTTVGAHIAITRKQLAVGQRGPQVERVDARHALGADDRVHVDDGLASGDRVVSAMKHRDLGPHLPAHFIRRVVQHGFFQADPRLWQPLGGELQDLQDGLLCATAAAENRPRGARHRPQAWPASVYRRVSI